MKIVVLSIVVIICLLATEARVFPTMPNSYWEIDEEIRVLKKRCEAIYPVASLEIDPATQNLIIKWKGGDSYGEVKKGEIYEEVGYPKYCVLTEGQIMQLMKIE